MPVYKKGTKVSEEVLEVLGLSERISKEAFDILYNVDVKITQGDENKIDILSLNEDCDIIWDSGALGQRYQKPMIIIKPKQSEQTEYVIKNISFNLKKPK